MTNRHAGLALAIVAALWLVVVLTGCEPDFSKRPDCNPPKDAGALKSMEQTPIVCSEDYCRGGQHIFHYESGQIWQHNPQYRCTWERLH